MLTGIYVFNPSLNFEEVFKNCVKWGIHWIVTPAYIFQKESFQQIKKKFDIKICAIFAVYNNQDYLEKNPADYCITSNGEKAKNEQPWLHFACPSSQIYFENRKKELYELVKTQPPEMIALDFIRFYVFWEKVYPDTKFMNIEDGCYCERCLTNFESILKQPLGERTAVWIKNNVLQQWTEWKCNVIEDTVKILTEIIRNKQKDLPIMMKTIPWLSKSFAGAIRSVGGQDLNRLSKYIDYLCPMTYNFMTKHPSKSINEVTSELKKISQKIIIPCIQVNKTYLSEEISNEKFDEMLKFGLQAPSDGIILFLYESLKDDVEKQEILKQRII